MAEFAGGEGFDVIYDTVGGATLDDSFAAAKIYTGACGELFGMGDASAGTAVVSWGDLVFTLLPMLTARGGITIARFAGGYEAGGGGEVGATGG